MSCWWIVIVKRRGSEVVIICMAKDGWACVMGFFVINGVIFLDTVVPVSLQCK